LIVEVEYLPTELVPDNPAKKYSIVDVRCKDKRGRQFIVEMQVFWQQAFYNRIVFNAGKAYVKQLNKAEQYHLLEPVYTLAILNENFDLKTDNYYHHFQIVNKENTEEIIPGLEFVLIELTRKFRLKTVNDKKLAVLWLRFLDEVNEGMKSLPPEMRANEYISKAAELCEESAFTPEELAAYERYWDSVRVEKTLMEGAMREGLEKGREEGREEGRAESKEEIEKLRKQIDELKQRWEKNNE
jgi:predicted transposase/invertase (TIGR01784 family)